MQAALLAIRVPVGSLVPGHLYMIRARNACVGIYGHSPEAKPQYQHLYTIPRRKFTAEYLFDEYDWDTGEPYGTAIPLRDLGPAPAFADDTAKLAWLQAQGEAHRAELSETVRNAIAAYQVANNLPGAPQ
jgi:hypothetical protein